MLHARKPRPTIALLALLTLAALFPLEAKLQASVMVLASVAFLLAARRRGSTTMPAVSIVCLAYLLGYAAPILLPSLYPPPLINIDAVTTERAAQWATIGYLSMLWGYLIAARWNRRHTPRRLQTERGRQRVLDYAFFLTATLGAVALAAWLIQTALFGISLTFMAGGEQPGNGTVLQILSTISHFRYAFFLGLLLLPPRRRRSKLLLAICAGLIVVSIVDIVTIGSKASVISLLVIVALATSLSHSFSARKQLVVGIGGVILIFLTFSVVTGYRHLMNTAANNGNNVSSINAQTDLFAQAVNNSLSSEPQAQTQQSQGTDTQGILTRFGSAYFSLAYTFAFTDGQSPYLDALQNLFIPVYAVAPRALMPTKPVYFNSADFAHDYFGWSYGGISISLIGSLYFAWGYVGIVLGMLLIGGFLGSFISRVEQHGILAPHSIVFATMLILVVLDTGAEFQPIFINLERVAVFVLCMRLAWALHLQGRGNLRSAELIANR